MKKIILSFAVLLTGIATLMAQNVGIGTTAPDASALLELKATNKGFLPPRMTAAEKNAISSPKQGLMIYQTDATIGLYIYNGTAWVAAAPLTANAWGLTGNAGTNPAVNFIGTKDDVAFNLKVFNSSAGRIEPINNGVNSSTGKGNVFLGFEAGKVNTGTSNTGIGTEALYLNSTGIDNSAIGLLSMHLNTTGSQNTALGIRSLLFNKTGGNNVAIGINALRSNQSGSKNVAVGDSALSYNLASGNVAVGSKSLYSNTTGTGNAALGFEALNNNTVGLNNTAVGFSALSANIDGAFNSAFGEGALSKTTSGFGNTAIGASALNGNLSGNDNVALGIFSLGVNTIGNNNSAMGSYALISNTNGNNNVAIGASALDNLTSGNNNTAIGSNTNITSSNTNSTAIGYSTTCSNSNSMSFGNGAVDSWAFGRNSNNAGKALQVGYNGTNGNGAFLTSGGVWTNASDSAKKEDITTLDGTVILTKIKQLPITRWKYKGTNEYHIGPMAQDFYKLFNVGTDDKSISSIDPVGIALKAIQEQQEEIDILKAENKMLKEKMEIVEAAVAAIITNKK